ncbi:MAG: FecR family protein [Bacteroidia bacterium]|nr:FecR family protein [Bacteroidia bacterium]
MEEKLYSSVVDFLNDDRFIAWRLYKTKELNDYWANYLAVNPHQSDLLQKASRRFEKVQLNKIQLDSVVKEELFDNIWTLIYAQQQRKRKQILYWTLVAASLAIILISVTFLKPYNNSRHQFPQEEIIGMSLPSENVQIIAGNNIVDLESNSAIEILDKGHASIIDEENQEKSISLAQNTLNKLIVPYGKRSFITLSDGTKVWINSGTELDFPTNFTKNTREIKVKGEIYLEVAKSDKQFLVHTPQSIVSVLGTTFNISAYEDDPTESIVLVEGKVQVKAGGDQNIAVLSPNDLAIISAHEITKSRVDVSPYISWRDGFLQFEKTSMEDVLHKIGRYYNISFEKNSNVALNAKTVSGKLFLFNNIDSVMTAVSVMSSTEYKREDNTILIQKKQ